MIGADETTRQDETRAGYVLLAGLPNAGKSTLLNRLVGEDLSIVTPKAQTTWQRVLGIRSEDRAQMVFLDTPGLLVPKSLFHRSMLGEAEAAREDADVAVMVVDGTRLPTGQDRIRIADFFGEISVPKYLVINKIDDVSNVPNVLASAGMAFDTQVHGISAKTGRGVEELLDAVRGALPESPFLFPEDEVAQAPVRFFVQEMVRETVFEQYHQEIPYSVVVRVDEFREDQEPLYVAATLFVERKSQKGMIVGKRGAAIRSLGAEARAKVEHFLDRRVYLDLWVKVAEGWSRDRATLKRFGYRIADDD